MPTLTSSAIRDLRARAHHLHPVVTIGQHGLTPAVLHELDLALLAHELIKVRVFNDERAEREAMLARVCAELGCAPVQHLGKLLIVWRNNPDKAAGKPKPEAKAKPKPSTGGKAKAKRGGPRPAADPVRERRRSTGTATGAGMVRRGAGRGQPVASVARETAPDAREDTRRPRAPGNEYGAGTGAPSRRPSGPASTRRTPMPYDGRQRDDRSSGSSSKGQAYAAKRRPAGPFDKDAPRDRYAAKAPRSTSGGRDFGDPPQGAKRRPISKPRPVSKRKPDADFEAAPPRDRFAGKPPRAMTTAGPRGYGAKPRPGARPPSGGKSAATTPRKPAGGRPPRHDPLSSKPAPRRRRTGK